MKKVETAEAVATAMANLFKEDWKGFVFENKARLVKVKHDIPGQLAWMLIAQRGEQEITFLLECSTKYAYACPVEFRYEAAEPSGEVYLDNKGNTGKVEVVNGEVAIVWDSWEA